MDSKISISPTSLDRFDCPLAWHWGKQYQSLKRRAALELGIGVHEALEAYYGKQKDPVKVFTKWIDKALEEIDTEWEDEVKGLMQNRTLGIAMLQGYVKEYRKEKFQVMTTEQTLRHIVPGTDGNCELNARLDAVVVDQALDQIFILEHKTFSRFEPDQLQRDHQLCAQVWLAQQDVGKIVKGVIYNGLRKQVPGPRVKLNLFERRYVYINDRQIKVFLRRVRETYRRMADPDFVIYPQPNPMRCSWCAFKQPCAAYCSGDDYKFILANLYTKYNKESDVED